MLLIEDFKIYFFYYNFNFGNHFEVIGIWNLFFGICFFSFGIFKIEIYFLVQKIIIFIKNCQNGFKLLGTEKLVHQR